MANKDEEFVDDFENNFEYANDDEEEDNEEKVQVRFKTALPEEYKVPETPIFVPISSTRYALSKIVNHLLSLEQSSPFDFLVVDGNSFLRTTLKTLLRKKNLNPSDALIELEYVLTLSPPTDKGDCIHEDWISTVKGIPLNNPKFSQKNLPLCFTGSYDGYVRIWNYDNGAGHSIDLIHSFSAHEKPIKSLLIQKIEFSKGKEIEKVHLMTSSVDSTIKWWKIERNSTEEKKNNNNKKKNVKNEIKYEKEEISIFHGHTQTVESLSLSPSQDNVASGSWDHTVKVWDLSSSSSSSSSDLDQNPKKKMKKSNEKTATLTLNGHSGNVSAVDWFEEGMIISGSWDHSIRVWDLSSQVASNVLHGGKPISSLSISPVHLLSAILTTHTDPTVRLWDSRSREGSVVKQHYKSHKEWVSQVNWHPTNNHLFCSSSHDGTVKIWDMRSSIPLHTHQIVTSPHKLLTVQWQNTGDLFFSGGSDNRLKISNFTP